MISEYFKDGGEVASVHKARGRNDFFIIYADNDGVIDTERFPGKSLQYVEDAAENWALGIKKEINADEFCGMSRK